MRMFGGDDPGAWPTEGHAAPRIFWDSKIEGYVIVDLKEWSSRWHFLSGRYYDWGHQAIMESVLKPGDTYIDIGANRGVHTMLASRLVGASGRVYSFEPNPTTFQVLKAHLLINRIQNCQALNIGLAEKEGELQLSSSDGTSGTCSFRNGPETNAHRVAVQRGDTALESIPEAATLLLKIDTEGYEFRVLQGLRNFLCRPQAMVHVEITPEWMSQIGDLPSELYEYMAGFGFKPYLVSERWRTNFFPKLALVPLKEIPSHQHEVVFSKNEIPLLSTFFAGSS